MRVVGLLAAAVGCAILLRRGAQRFVIRLTHPWFRDRLPDESGPSPSGVYAAGRGRFVDVPNCYAYANLLPKANRASPGYIALWCRRDMETTAACNPNGLRNWLALLQWDGLYPLRRIGQLRSGYPVAVYLKRDWDGERDFHMAIPTRDRTWWHKLGAEPVCRMRPGPWWLWFRGYVFVGFYVAHEQRFDRNFDPKLTLCARRRLGRIAAAQRRKELERRAGAAEA